MISHCFNRKHIFTLSLKKYIILTVMFWHQDALEQYQHIWSLTFWGLFYEEETDKRMRTMEDKG